MSVSATSRRARLLADALGVPVRAADDGELAASRVRLLLIAVATCAVAGALLAPAAAAAVLAPAGAPLAGGLGAVTAFACWRAPGYRRFVRTGVRRAACRWQQTPARQLLDGGPVLLHRAASALGTDAAVLVAVLLLKSGFAGSLGELFACARELQGAPGGVAEVAARLLAGGFTGTAAQLRSCADGVVTA